MQSSLSPAGVGVTGMEPPQDNRKHFKRKVGKDKDAKKRRPSGNDPRAFAPSNIVRAERQARRKADIQEKRLHVPLVDRLANAPKLPPIVVALVGPPKCGKTTLLKSLIKSYASTSMADIRGPVTMVTSSTRRMTFIECPPDLNSMMDVSKISDVVLLLVDFSFGFEIETFEFLNLASVHGFPKVLGILTHLDTMKRNSKVFQKRKKVLRQRFWQEVYPGAKIFEFSGLINGKYPKPEILHLRRHLAALKFRPLVWRNSHPYLLVDRVEDHTDPAAVETNPNTDREVWFYGYLHGTNMRDKSDVHIPGAGDFRVEEVQSREDPCPLPLKKGPPASGRASSNQKRLSEKRVRIHAPFSDVQGVMFDKDAIYISTPGDGACSSVAREITAGEYSRNVDISKFALLKNHTLKEPVVDNHFEASGACSDGSRESEKVLDRIMISTKGEDECSESGLEVGAGGGLCDCESAEIEVESDGECFATPGVKAETSETDAWSDGSGDSEDKSHGTLVDIKREDDGSEVDSVSHSDEISLDTGLSGSEGADIEAPMDGDLQAPDIQSVTSKRSLSSDTSDSESYGQSDGRFPDGEPPRLGPEPPNTGRRTEGDVKSLYRSPPGDRSALALEQTTRPTETAKSGLQSTDPEALAAETAAEGHSPADDVPADDKMESYNDQESQVSHTAPKFYESGTKWKERLIQKTEGSSSGAIRDWDELVYGSGRDTVSIPPPKCEARSEDISGMDINEIFGCARKTSRHTSSPVGQLARDFDLQDTGRSHQFDQVSVDKLVPGEFRDLFIPLNNFESGHEEEPLVEDLEDDAKQESDAMDEEERRAEHLSLQKQQRKEAFDREYDEGIQGNNPGKAGVSITVPNHVLKGKREADANFSNQSETYYDKIRNDLRERDRQIHEEFAGTDAATRNQIVGTNVGEYVRLDIRKVPKELLENFDPRFPLVVGGLLAHETRVGFNQTRLKRHRWHAKILKSNDPLVISVGWRRFQTIPMFSTKDDGVRNRMLKYTPEHMHCSATFWGPFCTPNTAFAAVKSTKARCDFRIAATGTILDLTQETNLTKKLKLTGTPHSITKHTVFVHNMFSTRMEAARFEGSAIRTVSGIRGMIKKALHSPEGAFRATFEDKILMSDIIFLRAWVPVEVKKFYHDLTTLLEGSQKSGTVLEMRTQNEVRRLNGIAIPHDHDSNYRPVERVPRAFNEVKIPAKLARDLPYKSQDKNLLPLSRRALDRRRKALIIRDPNERLEATFLQSLASLRNTKDARRKEKEKERKNEYIKKKVLRDMQSLKERRQKYFEKYSFSKRLNKSEQETIRMSSKLESEKNKKRKTKETEEANRVIKRIKP